MDPTRAEEGEEQGTGKGEGRGIGGMMESVRWDRIMDPTRAEEGEEHGRGKGTEKQGSRVEAGEGEGVCVEFAWDEVPRLGWSSPHEWGKGGGMVMRGIRLSGIHQGVDGVNYADHAWRA
jgi:hypothetical protein